MTRTHNLRRAIGTVALTGAALTAGLGASLSAFAQGKGIDEPLNGKTYAEETRNEFRLKVGFNF